jgi:hypothetical protein
MMLGDLYVIAPYPPAKLIKALAVIADALHPAFDLRPDIKPFYSRHACVLSSLTVRDFLVRIGFDAIVRPVATVIWSERDGKMAHSLGIGAPHDKRAIKDNWKGHMVVTVATSDGEFLIDTTLYPARRPQWRELPGMMALPLSSERVRAWWNLDVIASASYGPEGADALISWFDNPRNKSWQHGPDGRDPFRRMPVVEALVERFGVWKPASSERARRLRRPIAGAGVPMTTRKIVNNVRDGRRGWIGSFEVEPLVYDALSPEHIGRTVVYQDFGSAEAGTLTSWRNGIVFARYSRGDTSAGANAANLSLVVEKREDAG